MIFSNSAKMYKLFIIINLFIVYIPIHALEVVSNNYSLIPHLHYLPKTIPISFKSAMKEYEKTHLDSYKPTQFVATVLPGTIGAICSLFSSNEAQAKYIAQKKACNLAHKKIISNLATGLLTIWVTAMAISHCDS